MQGRGTLLLFLGTFLILGSLIFVVWHNTFFKQPVLEKMLREARVFIEKDSDESLYRALDILAQVASNEDHPDQSNQAMFHIAEVYEKLKMPEVAKRKYIELLNRNNISSAQLKNRVEFKIAKLRIMTVYKDEAYIRLLRLTRELADRNFLSEVYTELAKLYLRYKKVNKAITSLKIALRENPDNREAQKLLAMLQKDPEKETTSHSKPPASQKADPSSKGKEFLKVAFGYYGQHNYEKAIRYFRRAVNCCKNTPEEEIAWFYIGSSHARRKQYDQAIEAHKKVLNNSITARDQLSTIRIGQLYFDQGRYDDAFHYFLRSTNRYPNGKYLNIAREWKAEARKSREDKERYGRQF